MVYASRILGVFSLLCVACRVACYRKGCRLFCSSFKDMGDACRRVFRVAAIAADGSSGTLAQSVCHGF